MHTRDARKHGVSEQKLDVLAAWEEATQLFTERERAALALTEAITELGDGHVGDEVYQRAALAFSERELGQVIAMAVTINAWNRINVAARVQPPVRR
jgi:alkylhydroperoxidase family enzyme